MRRTDNDLDRGITVMLVKHGFFPSTAVPPLAREQRDVPVYARRYGGDENETETV